MLFHGSRAGLHTVLVLVILCLAWGAGFLALRLGENPIAEIEASSNARVGNIEWNQVDAKGLRVVSRPLVNRTGKTTGHVLMGWTDTLPAGSWIARMFVAPRRIEIAVLVDELFVVRGVWATNTSNPAVVGASWDDIKSRFVGVSGFLLQAGYGGKSDDSAALNSSLGVAVGETVVRLLEDACSRQFGRELSNGLTANRTDNPDGVHRFPYVAAYDLNGVLVTSRTWQDRPLVIATVNPACGHCIQVVRKALNDAGLAQKNCVRVIVLRAPASAGLSVQFLATLPADVLVLPDEDGDLSRMLKLEPAPVVAVITADGDLAGRYSAYRIDAVDEAIQKRWAGNDG